MNAILYGATGNIGKPYFALSTPSHNVTGLVHSPEKTRRGGNRATGLPSRSASDRRSSRDKFHVGLSESVLGAISAPPA